MIRTDEPFWFVNGMCKVAFFIFMKKAPFLVSLFLLPPFLISYRIWVILLFSLDPFCFPSVLCTAIKFYGLAMTIREIVMVPSDFWVQILLDPWVITSCSLAGTWTWGAPGRCLLMAIDWGCRTFVVVVIVLQEMVLASNTGDIGMEGALYIAIFA